MLTFENLPSVVEQLAKDISEIKVALQQKEITAPQQKPITRKELCGKLRVTEKTIIKWENRRKIPVIKIGSARRYDYVKVLAALETTKK